MKIYNGEGLLLGRLAAVAAKEALLGEEVKIVNSEKIFISGKKTYTFARAKQRRLRKGHPMRSACISRLPERLVRRSIRGMLPWKTARGREAFKRILCYRGIPTVFAAQELLSLPEASVKKLPTLKYTTIGEICQYLGGKRHGQETAKSGGSLTR